MSKLKIATWYLILTLGAISCSEGVLHLASNITDMHGWGYVAVGCIVLGTMMGIEDYKLRRDEDADTDSDSDERNSE